MDKVIQQELDVLCSSLFCQLCSVNITSISVERSHYSCKRHLDNVAAHVSRETERLSTKRTASLYPKAKKDGNSAAQVSNNQFSQISRVLNSPLRLHCYVCSESFSSTVELEVHLQIFPHVQLAKLKSNLIKLGIKKEFWTIQEGDFGKGAFVNCTLCQAQLQSAHNMESHFKSQRHINSYNNWCCTRLVGKGIPLSYIPWFYCNICDYHLNGTSDAEQHYTCPIHLRNSGGECSNSYAKIMQSKGNKLCGVVTAQNNRGVIENLHKDEATTSKTLKSPSISDAKGTNNTDDVSEERSHLKKQVLNELERLIQKLYCSQTVPYEISLDYLKRINKEVDEIAKNCNVKQEVGERSAVIKANPKTDTVEPNIYSNFNDSHINNDLDKAVCKKESKEDMKVNSKDDDLVLSKMSPALTHNVAQTSFERLANGSANSFNKNSLFEKKPSSIAIFGQTTDISELLDGIRQRKSNILYDAPEGLLEIDLLNEIEILLKQIDKGDIPLAETLKCLEKYNKALDEDDSNNKDTEVCHEELSGEKSGLGDIADGETSEVREIQNQDQNMTGDGKNINDAAASQTGESDPSETNLLIKLKPKEASVSQTEPDLPMEASELYECRRSLSLYNYYAGNNLHKFMDFCSAFLNGSMEDLQNWNALKNHNSLLNKPKDAVQDTLESNIGIREKKN